MTIGTITRSEYKSKQRQQYAGSKSTLEPETIAAWRAQCPDWKGMHWHMFMHDTGGVALAPVNVVKDPPTSANTPDLSTI